MKEKPKGGVRIGAGRKPSADPKQPVTIFVETSKINAYGGKEGVQLFCYSALDADEPNVSRVRSGLRFQKPIKKPKSAICSELDKSVNLIEKAKGEAYDAPPLPKNARDEHLKVGLVKPKTLDELKSRCPKELTGIDRSMWISTERQKYGI